MKTGGHPQVTTTDNGPIFSEVVYQGNDSWYRDYPLEQDEFYNPILPGCYPDPAITRKGDDYYLVCSSFAMFPGVPIFHSNDLVNWTQLGHALDRTSQLDVHNTGISAGVYAPGITYNPHNDTFYLIVTAVAGGLGNIVVKTKDPEQGWIEAPHIYKKDGRYLLLQRTEKGESKIIGSTKIGAKQPVRLQVTARGDAYEFSYAVGDADFTNLGGTVSGDILSTNVARGFTGCLLGLYATSANDAIPGEEGN